MPHMTLVLSETVAVGAFNPRIITPSWLVKNDVVREPEWLEDILDSMPIDENGFPLGGFGWDVDQERLIVSADRGERDCGAVMGKVIELLRHTPISAVGHNFHYTCPISDWPPTAIPMLGQRSGIELGVTETRWTGRFDREGLVVEVELLYVPKSDDVVSVRTNFERQTGEKWEGAVSAARTFPSDRKAAAELATTLFGLEVGP